MPDDLIVNFKPMVDALDESKDRAAIEGKYAPEYRCLIYASDGSVSMTDRYGNAIVENASASIAIYCKHCHLRILKESGVWHASMVGRFCAQNPMHTGHEPMNPGERPPLPGHGMIPAPGSELHYGSITPEVETLMRQINELQGRMLGAKILRRAMRYWTSQSGWDLLDAKVHELLDTPRNAEYFTSEWEATRTTRMLQTPYMFDRVEFQKDEESGL